MYMFPLVFDFMFIFFLFVVFDLMFFWVNRDFLDKTIRKVQRTSSQIRLAGAVLCYSALTALLYASLSLSYGKTFALGACVYAVYEGTNYAIFENWPATMVLMDTLWGGLLFVLVKYTYLKVRVFF
jgi:uncharacterized membrane protein